MRSSILAKEVTSWRSGREDDDDEEDDVEDDDDADVWGGALAVAASSHAALPNMSQQTQTTVRA